MAINQNATIGNPKRSRTRRSNAASRARANASDGHAIPECRQIPGRVVHQRGPRRLVQRRTRGLKNFRVERRQPGDQRVPRLAAQPAGHTLRQVELAGRRIDQVVELTAEAAVRARGRQPHHDALEMGRQRTAPGPILVCRVIAGRLFNVLAQPDGSTPFVEGVEDIGFAEVDFHRPPPGALPGLALEAAVDPAERHVERHALSLPARDEIERRPDHADEVTVILPTQVGLDTPAVVSGFVARQFAAHAG